MPHRSDHHPEDVHAADDVSVTTERTIRDGMPVSDRTVRDETSVTGDRVETYRSEDVAAVDDASGGYGHGIAGRINLVLFAVLLAVESLLALRFALVAFGANLGSGFVDFIMDVSWPFVRAFDGAFANRTWDEGIIEVSTLLAIGVYALVFALIAMLLSALLPRVTGYDRHERAERRSVIHGSR